LPAVIAFAQNVGFGAWTGVTAGTAEGPALGSKLRLIVGLASRLTQSTGADQVPAVREVLGRLTALEATLGGMIHGQVEAWERWPEGFATFNRRYMYAALNWGTEMYSQLIDILRELSGGGVFQMPASVTIMHDPAHRKLFETYWRRTCPLSTA
jgi:4-hydroxyphenylacetate 3-monooxygenase